MDLTTFSEAALLQIHADVIEELKQRGVVRTSNNPIGDYTEWLICDRLELALQTSSKSSFDGIDAEGLRYQIKGRRIESSAGYAQLSVIRNLEQRGFDFLIAVIYNPDYSIRFAAKIPHVAVAAIATFRTHVNGHIPILRESVFDLPGVVDITALLTSRTSSQ